jgi:hypothetical protein
MRKLALLASVIILTPLGLAAAVKSLTPDMPASAPPGAATISIDEIHRQVNVRSLPELEITDLY